MYNHLLHSSVVQSVSAAVNVLQVKIQGQNKEMLAAACQMFMGKSEGEISNIALETLEGHQRAIIAHLTVEVLPRAKRAVCILYHTQRDGRNKLYKKISKRTGGF